MPLRVADVEVDFKNFVNVDADPVDLNSRVNYTVKGKFGIVKGTLNKKGLLSMDTKKYLSSIYGDSEVSW